jgi:hypothetical protein
VSAQTVRKGEVIAAEHTWGWLQRPTARVGGVPGWEHSVLRLDGVPYLCEAFFVSDAESSHHWTLIDLRRCPVAVHHRVCLGNGEESCTCGQATYRSVRCKHAACVADALAWLERREHEEWLDGLPVVDAEADPFAEVLSDMAKATAELDCLITDLTGGG